MDEAGCDIGLGVSEWGGGGEKAAVPKAGLSHI
jgi:hypothetical protein